MEEEKKDKDNEEAEVFQKNKKVQRSPHKKAEEESGVERLIKKMREGFKKELWEMRQDVMSQGKEVREEIGRMREEMRKGEERGRKEREELNKRMVKLEKRVEEAEGREWSGEDVVERTKKLEREKSKEAEQGARKRGGETERRGEESAGRVLQSIRVHAKMEEARETEKRRGGGREGSIAVRMESVEGKAEVMRKKGNLRGRKERIEEDLTWEEKRMQWLIKERANAERRKGKVVRIGYGKLFVNGTAWFWDEKEEVLKDGRGRERVEERGTETSGKEKQGERRGEKGIEKNREGEQNEGMEEARRQEEQRAKND